ncbi:MAG: tRNA (adenosine(37)-N6)-dimethylallyltransferase MiaA [Pseudomonadota bacterium]|nr:tRNA (adenosine(37)-N6)-dimethylallyltransferase MiaA [Pseudomonadota bacterium]
MTPPRHHADRRPPAIFLIGPTASGKTALACALAEAFPIGLISVDSALVYRGLDIGAAKPDAATLRRYPHRLIDIRDPAQPYSAAAFRQDASTAMEEIVTVGRVPLLVGGTGLYFHALQHGLSELPEADPDVRARTVERAQKLGWPALHAQLALCDPVAAARIRANDAQRIQRALEVIELCGKPLSQLQRGAHVAFSYRVLKLALVPSNRDALRARIAERFDAMLAAGLLDEVRRLRARGDLHTDLPALRAVGYRQAWQHLHGEYDARMFRERAIFATRQLAKRQSTWLRREYGARVIDPDRGDPLVAARDALALFLEARVPRGP